MVACLSHVFIRFAVFGGINISGSTRWAVDNRNRVSHSVSNSVGAGGIVQPQTLVSDVALFHIVENAEKPGAVKAREICVRLLTQIVLRADSRATLTAGSVKPIIIAIIVMTTNNSTSVKPLRTTGFFIMRFMVLIKQELRVVLT